MNSFAGLPFDPNHAQHDLVTGEGAVKYAISFTVSHRVGTASQSRMSESPGTLQTSTSGRSVSGFTDSSMFGR
jgi:hypothetical protein